MAKFRSEACRTSMRTCRSLSILAWLTGTFVCISGPARAQVTAEAKSAPASPVEDERIVKARELFAKGAKLVEAAQWAEALGAFEDSSKLRPHPITTYNIGACERALGRYTQARATLRKALLPMPESGARLPDALAADASAYLTEIERLLVRVDLSIAPIDAAIAVDGRPLAATEEVDGRKVFLAGRRPAGPGQPLGAGRAELVLDPGAHVFTLSRQGFSDLLVNRTFKPGAQAALKLNLDQLPGRLRVSSNQPDSVVRIEQVDVGHAPVSVERPAGAYEVQVQKAGFVSYETTVNLRPGEAADIRANLAPKTITEKWWFWTAAGALVIGALVTTHFATRSTHSERPPLDGGGLDWTIRVP